MKQAKNRKRRTAAEIQQLLRHYEDGTLPRVEFCAAHRLPFAYRRRYRLAPRASGPAGDPGRLTNTITATGRKVFGI